ncbi:MAG: hypothetical protein F4X60_14280 [Gemmatimonadetes bacterium]|nr:hypothetical protein [Gemmatimonadota bacterium]MYB99705.1 hypothetical protein [Gemmatimonadota bacterium]
MLMVGAGLPQLVALSGEAKSYSERLFDFPGVGPLDENATGGAILRTGLIRKGMIWSPAHGETAFTVPMFDRYMLRAMPDWPPSGG